MPHLRVKGLMIIQMRKLTYRVFLLFLSAVIGWEKDDYSLAESAGHTQVCLVRSGDTNTTQRVGKIKLYKLTFINIH